MKQIELIPKLTQWIEQDAEASEPMLKKARQKRLMMLPIWVILCIAAACALGFAVGYDLQYILRVHFLLGLGIGAFVVLGTLLQQSSISKKRLIKMYTRGASHEFDDHTEQDQIAFCRQMSEKDYGEVEYKESQTFFPTKFIIGPDCWVYRSSAHSVFTVTADVAKVQLGAAKTNSAYTAGGAKTRTSLTVAVELRFFYKADMDKSKIYPRRSYHFEKPENANKVLELIKKYCPEMVD